MSALVHIFDNNSTGSYTVTYASQPTVTWGAPAPIAHGTPLSSAQLNATASVPGSFSYDPPAGTVLPVGNVQTLSVTFTPADSANYSSPVTETVTINVQEAPPAIAAASSVCPNSTGNPASGPAGESSYSWTVSGGAITSGATAQAVTYTAGASGNVVLTLMIQDSSGATAYSSVTIPMSAPPVPADNLLGTTQDQPVEVPVVKLVASATSPSNGALSITAVNPASTQGGTVALATDGSLITYAPPGGYTGQDEFTYTLSDGCGTAQGTVSVTITPANAPSQNQSAITVTDTGVNLLFNGIPGVDYVVQWAPAVTGPWQDLGTVTADLVGQIPYTDSRSPLPPSGFYRTRVGP
jgi:hypothetical protein